MTPDERQLISGLFDRMQTVGNQSRDREAEQLIADQVRSQPYAPYLLTQTVLVQDHALKAANDRILELEDQVRKTQPASGQDQGGGSFLGGLGRMFGGGPDPRGASVPTTGGHGPAPLPPEPGPYRGQGYPPQPASPWGNQGAQPQQGGGLFGGGAGGGSFMKGALGAAAGVAGGVLVADGIRNLFSGGHNDPFGMASGLGGGMGGLGNAGGETIVNNNYYDTPQDNQDLGDQGGGDAGNYGAADPGGYDNSGGDPGSYT